MGAPQDGAALPAPEVVTPVRTSADVYADAIEQGEAEAEQGLTVTIGDQVLRARTHRPVGAWAVFCARIKSSAPVDQAAAPIKLLERWIVPEDHDKLADAFAEIDNMEHWAEHVFPGIVEQLVQRPTSAP